MNAHRPVNEPHTERDLAPGTVHMVFVGALLLVVLGVIAEYLLGDFKGLNHGADFGLVIGVSLVVAFLAGLVAAVLHVRAPKDH